MALIVVGIAAILASAAFGFGMLFTGKVLVLDAIVTPIVAALGTQWAIVAASVAAAIGLIKLVSGILMLKQGPAKTEEVILNRGQGLKFTISANGINLKEDLSHQGLFELPYQLRQLPGISWNSI